jgi:Fe2+ or Zn2+ uptake regulation protein
VQGKVRLIFRKRETIEKMILSYLEQNPDATDTIEGITNFWMKRQNTEIAISKVSHTLEKLVKKGHIKVFQSLDGTLYYKLQKDSPEREQTVH